MKRILLTLTLVLFIAPIAKAQQTISSLENFINQNPDLTLFHSIADHHYFVKDEPMTWTDSKNHGDKIGVSMYVINDQAEENEVFSNLPINTGYWLGLYQDIDDPNFSEPNGGWKWVDGSELSYTNWFTNEPNDVNGEDYVEFNDGQGIRWNDVPNDNAGNLNIPIYEFVSFGDILLNGTVSAENNQIKNVADPTEAQDAVTKSYFDANKLISPNKNIAQILSVGNDAYGKQLKGLADPTDAQDAVTLSLLQTKINELIERIEVLESNANYDCGLAYFEDFSSCDLNGYYAQGGNITSTNSSFDGCGVYMTHYAGQDPNNFYAVDKKFLYGVYELEAIADNGISDNIVRVLQQEELTGGYTFSFRPTSTDNPGWSVYNDGELVDSADTFPVARGAWYSIKIEVLKSSLKVWINDVVLFETDSITPPSDIPGYFKVGVAYSGGFDNLKFTPYSSACE